MSLRMPSCQLCTSRAPLQQRHASHLPSQPAPHRHTSVPPGGWAPSTHWALDVAIHLDNFLLVSSHWFSANWLRCYLPSGGFLAPSGGCGLVPLRARGVPGAMLYVLCVQLL